MADTPTNTRSLLILGRPSSGKSHYLAQVMGRLRRGDGSLRMRGAPSSLRPLEDIRSRLAQGLLGRHTPTDTRTQMVFPMETVGGEAVDLVWPEYGGEQVNHLLTRREIPADWADRIRGSSGWMLLIRPSALQPYEDLLSRPLYSFEHAAPAATVTNGGVAWVDSAEYVELMQMCLYVRGRSGLYRVRDPLLCVGLTCWDELGQVEKTPEEVLGERLPLFAQYLRANWDPGSLRVYGISALGRSLDNEKPDPEFIDHGPERQGFVVLPDGSTSADLTAPIAWLLGQS
jgi:hypothetical protein